MGRGIIDICTCGKHVQPDERQDLGLDEATGKWQRICAKCIRSRPKEYTPVVDAANTLPNGCEEFTQAS